MLATPPRKQPRLSEAEWALVFDLLIKEQDRLPVELDRTTLATPADSYERLAMVNDLVTRLRENLLW